MAAMVKGGRKGGIKERKKNADEKRRQGEEKGQTKFKTLEVN
jgi:hypothetical protein